MSWLSHAARVQRASTLIALAVFAGALAMVLGLRSADAAPRVLVLGASRATANPACPASPCQAVGKVTGFQTMIAGQRAPFKVPFDGKIVAWSIKLSRPTDEQRDFFNDFFGEPPQARIAVLRSLASGDRNRFVYRLVRHGPIENLTPVLGQTTTFVLGRPLTVLRGQVVALSIPTWAPAFAIGQSGRTRWLASRKAGNCLQAADIKAGSAQQKIGSKRGYRCGYRTARLLYSATLVRGKVRST